MGNYAIPNREYWALHKWLVYNFGSPKACEKCNQAKKHIDWANISGRYQRSRDDFMALCRSCHRVFDRSHCKNGHLLSLENIYHSKSSEERNVRRCKVCARAATKRYDDKRRARV